MPAGSLDEMERMPVAERPCGWGWHRDDCSRRMPRPAGAGEPRDTGSGGVSRTFSRAGASPMTDPQATPAADAAFLPPVPSLVAVTGPTIDGAAAGIVTAALAGDDGAVSVVIFAPGSAVARPIAPVYPDGYPGDGYRYRFPDWPAEPDTAGLAGPDGDPGSAGTEPAG